MYISRDKMPIIGKTKQVKRLGKKKTTVSKFVLERTVQNALEKIIKELDIEEDRLRVDMLRMDSMMTYMKLTSRRDSEGYSRRCSMGRMTFSDIRSGQREVWEDMKVKARKLVMEEEENKKDVVGGITEMIENLKISEKVRKKKLLSLRLIQRRSRDGIRKRRQMGKWLHMTEILETPTGIYACQDLAGTDAIRQTKQTEHQVSPSDCKCRITSTNNSPSDYKCRSTSANMSPSDYKCRITSIKRDDSQDSDSQARGQVELGDSVLDSQAQDSALDSKVKNSKKDSEVVSEIGDSLQDSQVGDGALDSQFEYIAGSQVEDSQKVRSQDKNSRDNDGDSALDSQIGDSLLDSQVGDTAPDSQIRDNQILRNQVKNSQHGENAADSGLDIEIVDSILDSQVGDSALDSKIEVLTIMMGSERASQPGDSAMDSEVGDSLQKV